MSNMDLNDLRLQIDNIDTKLCQLIKERQALYCLQCKRRKIRSIEKKGGIKFVNKDVPTGVEICSNQLYK